jgi:predicted DsbA family dithiol-disulfide isomerase
VFPDTNTKLQAAWRDKGGFEGYADHVRGVAAQFSQGPVHEDVWSKVRPSSSASPHMFLKSIELIEDTSLQTKRPSVLAAKELRNAFFVEARDIANWNVQREICERIGLDFDAVLEKVETGEAIAALAADYQLGQSLGVQGSPTYLMNEGRQKLYGNIDYGILSANVVGLLSEETDGAASPCA